MKKLWQVLVRALELVGDFLFETLMFLSEDSQAEDDSWDLEETRGHKSGANCHLCDTWVPEAHPNDEFVVCSNCLTTKPS